MSENKILLSIIIPLFNKLQYVEKCMDGLIENRFDGMQIIIVNDESTDGSDAVCKEYAQKYDFITVIDQKNMGLAGARNTGMKYAEGEYITFLDADDYIDQGAYETMMKRITEGDYDILQYGLRLLVEGKEPEDAPTVEEDTEFIGDEVKTLVNTLITQKNAKEKELSCIYNCCSACNHIYRTSLIKDNDMSFFAFWNNEDDILFNIRIYQLAKRILIVKDCYYNYIMASDSMSREHRYVGNIYDKRIASYDWYKEQLEKIGADKETECNYLGVHKRTSILYSLYDVTQEKCPLSKQESIDYLLSIYDREKNIIDRSYYSDAGRIDRLYLNLFRRGHIRLLYFINRNLLKKYRR